MKKVQRAVVNSIENSKALNDIFMNYGHASELMDE